MNYEVTLEAVLCDETCTDDQVSGTFDAVMEALVALNATDPFVGGSLATRQLEITMVVEAVTQDEAFKAGGQIITRALERAGLHLGAPPTASAALSWSSTSVRPAV